MKFNNASFSIPHLWSSPFVRWQGSLADISSIDLAASVTDAALTQRGMDRSQIDQLILGTTIPQQSGFYGAPWLATRLGMPDITGPILSQACATSVACIAAAAARVEVDKTAVPLVVTTDRTSNGPVILYPRTNGMGGSPLVENWVLDSFAADPATGQAMIKTAENVAKEGAMSRSQIDELTILRWEQYQRALADDRKFQKRYMQPIAIKQGRKVLQVDADAGVHPYSLENLVALNPVIEGGLVTYGTQTHPADGCAGAIVASGDRARALSSGNGIVRILSAGFARVDPVHMPKAATNAAMNALQNAGIGIKDIKFVVSHNPFAVNDLWFIKQTGFSAEQMNPYGCSLIYGHPQGPTGLRGIVELVYALQESGGGVGIFTGCAAGDTGAALVLSVS